MSVEKCIQAIELLNMFECIDGKFLYRSCADKFSENLLFRGN